jgi:hypothetical protein
MFYICPLGDEKHEIDALKYNENNLKMITIVEATKNSMKNQRKIAEDDEFEYYTED